MGCVCVGGGGMEYAEHVNKILSFNSEYINVALST